MTVWQETLPSDTVLVGVRGRLDQSLNPTLEQTLNDLLDSGRTHFIVDLTEASYINSGGLRCLVSVWRRAREHNGSLRLCGLNPRLQEIFSMVGFDKVFEIYDSCAEARQVVNSNR